jgi:hypothetical protein
VVTTKVVTETRIIPFRTSLVRDPQMPRGQKRVQSPGVSGEEVLRYLVTYTDGRQTDRRLIDSDVTREPQDRVVAFGTRRTRDGGDECREGPCFPDGRSAACPEGADPVKESGAVQLGGSVAVLDEDLYLLDPSDLDGLELDSGMIC